MFSFDEFSRLDFLIGRWKGEAPDGTPFFEEYDRPEPNVFRSRRFSDASFAEHTDGSTIALENGEVVSRWGAFSWRATRIDAHEAAFDPVDAPSRFTWRRIDADALEVRQHWQADGKDHQYTIPLARLDADPGASSDA